MFVPLKRVFALAMIVVTMLAAAANGRAASSRDKKLDFNTDIRPILSENCFHCHGPDEKQRKAKLRLDVADSAFKERDGTQAVKPHDLKKSELWRRITTKNQDDLMPPPESHKTLKPEQIAALKKWIEQGAEYKGHWAFIAPVRPELPTVKNSRWVKNEIDSFIEAKLENKGLKPNGEASKEILIRRVTFDLTGLPPTPAEVDAFLADTQPDAYERLVNRLLGEPQYGEHMAHYWLDAARYGDTHGMHLDNERSMWPYRDWVVRSFNDNLPFDKFTTYQLAGDLLPNATRDELIASGFNRCNVTSGEGGSIDAELYARYAVDRTTTAAEVWMGLTVGCAVCHDHKFDPITQKEFYQMYAFFNNNADPAMDGNILLTAPMLKLSTPDQDKELDDFKGRIEAAQKKVKDALAKIEYSDPATNNPPPEVKTVDTVWVDDDFPKAKVNEGNKNELKWATAEDGHVFSGKRAIKISGKEVVQDFFTGAEKPQRVLKGGRFYAYVYLDPQDSPKAVMLQFNTGKWEHRGVWGDVDAIDFGKKDSTERLYMGPLPKSNEWVRLEIPADKLKLKTGTKIEGMAFTQFGGTAYWDKAGQIAETNPAKDPTLSEVVWQKQHQGKPDKELPREIQDIFKLKDEKERKPEQVKKLHDYFIEFVYADAQTVLEPLNKELKQVEGKRDEFYNAIPATLIMKDLDKPRESFVLIRGQYNKTGERVYPNVPAILPPLPKSDRTNRLDFAEWLVNPKHPLTARVEVNRLWQQFFGMGIVKTAGDFGSQGEPPSHPELLDWLATKFIDSGWDMKAMCKLIVMSSTYRQDSKTNSKLLQADPDNRLLAHGPRFRLDAEEIRDNTLYVSGMLSTKIGGHGVKPYQPENIWEPVAYSGSNTREYKQDNGDALYRRSLYTFWKRTAPAPSMTTFDAPSRESFCLRRERSNTPLQALILMNDIQNVEAARHLAGRMLAEGGSETDDRLAFGFRLCTSRKPTKSEQAVLRQAFQAQLARYEASPEDAKKLIAVGESKPPANLNPTELAAYTMAAEIILNLDETVNKN